jgi:hypothetical protein
MGSEKLGYPSPGTMEVIIDAHRRASLSVMVYLGCPSDCKWCRFPPRVLVLECFYFLDSVVCLGSAEDDGKDPPECVGHGTTYFPLNETAARWISATIHLSYIIEQRMVIGETRQVNAIVGK